MARRFGMDVATWPQVWKPFHWGESDDTEQVDVPLRDIPPLSVQRLMQLVDPELAGDPDSGMQWVRRSLHKLQKELKASGLELSPHTISRVLLAYGISPKANVKHLMPRPHPDRDRQFRHIIKVRRRFEQAGWPEISVDTKKKQLVGLFKNPGRAWTDEAIGVYTYDFPDDAVAKAVPYGVYDPQAHRGSVYVGVDGDTPDLAVDAIVRWWQKQGRHRYPSARRLLILADGGGSNGYRPRRWKTQLQRRLVNAFGLTVTVCHYPPGASKWNPVEHALFSQISQTWAGLPLTSLLVLLSAIRSTTTSTGLRVTAELMPGAYPRHLTASQEEWESLHIKRHKTCPKWNYTLAPSKTGK
jgi:hypothetical protein